MNRKFDDLAKQRAIGIVMAGGSRDMAARYLKFSIKTIYNAIKKDAEFGKQLAEAENFLTPRHRRGVQELAAQANRERTITSLASAMGQDLKQQAFLRMLAGMT